MTARWIIRAVGVSCLMLLLSGCVRKPQGVQPVQPFELPRYLGKWYEIARLDHSFESGLQQVTAEYSMRDDGGIKVVNKGFDVKEGAWKSVEGKAYFVEEPTKGYLKVSFFGPFYGAYVVFALDENYEYAFVSGPTKDYLWLLAREPNVAPAVYEAFVERANQLEFDTSELIRVSHNILPR